MTENERKLPIILIGGATATGKTSFSIGLAQKLKDQGINSEVINGDSLLFYRELNIGTAKPSLFERGEVPHHLIDICSVKNEMNANSFCEKAHTIIKNLHEKEVVPIIAGGSAFYIRALIKGMGPSTKVTKEIKEKIQLIEDEQGLPGLRTLLKNLDPKSHERIHSNDQYRTTRALEHCLSYGDKFSKAQDELERNGPYDFSKPKIAHWEVLNIFLNIPKEEHWEIIKNRSEKMIEDGLISEVKALLKEGYSPELKPLQSIGYKEVISFLNEESSDTANLAQQIFIATRRLAKSQKTFFKKIEPKQEFNPLLQKTQFLDCCEQFLTALKL